MSGEAAVEYGVFDVIYDQVEWLCKVLYTKSKESKSQFNSLPI